MHRLQDLVRLHRMGTRVHEVARLLGMSPNTERVYRRALREASLLEGDPGDLPEARVLREAIENAMPSVKRPQHVSSVDRWVEHVTQMLAGGATPTAIYDRLRLENEEFGGSLSAIKRLCARLRKAKGINPNDVAIPVDTAPGHIAQVDFGNVGKLWDPETGRHRKAYVFVLVLGFSRHMFARIVFDQKIETWLALHVEAFAELGGVPEVIVPDNLKSAVIRAAFGMRDEPVLNRSYRELARHFGFKIDPTPAYSPQKKGKVEAGVKYVKKSFFAARADELDVSVLRRELVRWVTDVAGMRKHGTTRRKPRDAFEQTEREALLAIPVAKWEPIIWRTPTLRRDCHVVLDGARYSAPWRLIGRSLLARMTESSVILLWEDVRVATHERKSPGESSTNDEHLPEQRSSFRHRERSY